MLNSFLDPCFSPNARYGPKVIKLFKKWGSNSKTTILIAHDLNFFIKKNEYYNEGTIKKSKTPNEISFTTNKATKSNLAFCFFKNTFLSFFGILPLVSTKLGVLALDLVDFVANFNMCMKLSCKMQYVVVFKCKNFMPLKFKVGFNFHCECL
jgi:hypothetical protein